MERYVRWYRSGYNSSIGRCFDIGNQTSQALQKFERDYNNAIADHSSVNPFCGPTDDAYSGNGSLMRLAPVPMAYAYADVELLEKIAIDSSRTTHGSVACLTSCAEMAIIVARSLLTGQEATHLHHFEGMRGVPVEEVESSGYVCHTRDAAYWAVANHKTFRSALIAAVNLGGDTDTVGAVTGMLAGAIYGESSIPDEWLRILHRSKHIRSMADRLFAVAPR
jgi:ADP-ribosyl-[dinitrogen reductase] hydrolase